jgi:pimeloyl-ACP methyl ester carboxylesterase
MLPAPDGSVRPLTLLIPLALAAALPAAASAATPSSFYTPPRPLPGSGHGGLIRHQPLSSPAAIAGGRTTLVLYRSVGVEGKPVAVSGTVTVPKGTPPKRGWPLITWAHGTTGIADQCAPSTDDGSQPLHGNTTYVAGVMQGWLKSGYAIARTDYEGLGTPGVHPYLVGTSAGRSVLDAARAARALDKRISDRVIVAGHSQGGHAALWAASLAPAYAPDLDVRGTVAYAPASQVDEQAPLLSALTAPGGLSGLVAMILRGVNVANPHLDVGAVLSDRAAALYPETLTKCLSDLDKPDSFGSLAPADFVRPGADISAFLAAVDANDPDQLEIRAPVHVEQGEADTTVFPQFTLTTVGHLAANGASIDEQVYPNVTHGDIVTAAKADAAAWIRSRLK